MERRRDLGGEEGISQPDDFRDFAQQLGGGFTQGDAGLSGTGGFRAAGAVLSGGLIEAPALTAPAGSFTNLVDNYSFETAVTGSAWAASGGTLTHTATTYQTIPHGLFVGVFTKTGSSGDGICSQTFTSGFTPGEVFGASGWLRPEVNGRAVRVRMFMFDATFTLLGSSTSPAPASPQTERWYPVGTALTVPAGTAFIVVDWFAESMAVGDVFLLDACYAGAGDDRWVPMSPNTAVVPLPGFMPGDAVAGLLVRWAGTGDAEVVSPWFEVTPGVPCRLENVGWVVNPKESWVGTYHKVVFSKYRVYQADDTDGTGLQELTSQLTWEPPQIASATEAVPQRTKVFVPEKRLVRVWLWASKVAWIRSFAVRPVAELTAPTLTAPSLGVEAWTDSLPTSSPVGTTSTPLASVIGQLSSNTQWVLLVLADARVTTSASGPINVNFQLWARQTESSDVVWERQLRGRNVSVGTGAGSSSVAHVAIHALLPLTITRAIWYVSFEWIAQASTTGATVTSASITILAFPVGAVEVP